MNKRDVFAELTQGFEALEQSRQGKATLKTTEMEAKEELHISAKEISSIRRQLNVSRPVFANMLRMNPRTLEGWEQGRSKPDQGAATLLRLVQSHPETLTLISKLA